MPDFRDLLRFGVESTGGTALQDALGAMAGLWESRALPEAGPDRTLLWRSRNPDASPRALGNSLILGANPSDIDMAHELRHVRQSRTLGPLNLPLSALGGDLGALEEDAYLATEPQGSPELENRAAFQRAAGETPNPLLVRALQFLVGRSE